MCPSSCWGLSSSSPYSFPRLSHPSCLLAQLSNLFLLLRLLSLPTASWLWFVPWMSLESRYPLESWSCGKVSGVRTTEHLHPAPSHPSQHSASLASSLLRAFSNLPHSPALPRQCWVLLCYPRRSKVALGSLYPPVKKLVHSSNVVSY